MKSATDQILNECRENGLKILGFATEGQWIKLMSRDSKDKPLTVFQFQKDIWNSTKSLSKQALIKRISETNKVDPRDYFQIVQMLKELGNLRYHRLIIHFT